MNAEQVMACMAVPGQRFHHLHGHKDGDTKATAAVELQASYRRRMARRRVASLVLQRAAAKVLTRKGKVLAMQVSSLVS